MFLQLLQQNKSKHIPTLDEIQHCLYESRTFISKGFMSNTFFDFVHRTDHSKHNTDITIAKLYNFIYLQVFNLLWKPRYAQVIVYEQQLGVTNRDKRSMHCTLKFNYQPKHPLH